MTGKPFWTMGNYFLFNDTPQWIDLKHTQSLFELYHRNPVYFSTINILANEMANMKFFVMNKKTGEYEPENTKKEIPKKIYRLLNFPNPLQSRWEFLRQNKILHEVAGNSFVFANAPFGMKPNISNIQTLQNIWPQYMKAKVSGKYFSITEIEDLIEKWVFRPDTDKITFEPNQILHRNTPNTDSSDLILGKSTALSLIMPLSNIEMAYESRNVLMRNRGMRAIISSALGDMTGKIPVQETEKKSINEAMKNYGIRKNQNQFFFSPVPLDVKTIDQDVRKLGLFEEIEHDAIEVAHAHGVPDELLKKSLEGTTFSNQDSAYKRLYQGTIIPQSNDFVISLNRFLGLEEEEWEIVGSFDHIPSLQKSEKEKHDAYKSASVYLEKLFYAGAISLNTWLDQMELPMIKEPYGDLTLIQMDDEQREMVLRIKPSAATQPEPANEEEKKINGHKLKNIVHEN